MGGSLRRSTPQCRGGSDEKGYDDLTAALLMLGTIAMTTSAQAQVASTSRACPFGPYIEQAACDGGTGYCGCGPGRIF